MIKSVPVSYTQRRFIARFHSVWEKISPTLALVIGRVPCRLTRITKGKYALKKVHSDIIAYNHFQPKMVISV